MKYPRLYNGVRLLGEGPCLKNVERIDSGAFSMIQSMAHSGLQVDLEHFAKLEKQLGSDMEQVTEKVHEITGYWCNIDSPEQISDLLFKKLGLKQARPKFTRGSSLSDSPQESTDYETLVAIQHDHEVIPLILEHKELSKLKGTYVSPMPRLAIRVRANEYRLFPNFNTTRIAAGRLVAKNPNLLAMPSRTERGRDIRRGFICNPGWVYLTVDVSQIHVRLGAHMSEDENLIRVYQNEEDIYSDFATVAFKLKDERYRDEKGKWQYPTVDKMDHRYPAKTCILASIYEVSAGGLLEQMPIVCANCNWFSLSIAHPKYTPHTCGKFVPLWNEDNCQDLINKFYIRYPGIMQERMRVHGLARRNGYIWDMWGRLLHLPAVRSVHQWIVSAALREAGNFPYLGGEQGVMKLIMAEVQDQIEMGLEEVVKPALQVHDELIFTCREDVAEEFGEYVIEVSRKSVPFLVPIKAGAAIANSWGELEK